jgi:hypothetical protein
MTKDSIIEGLDVYNTSGAAIQIYNTGGDSPDNNIIRNSRFHDITRSGYTSGQGTALLLDGGIGNQVYNNVIYGIDLPGNQTTHVGIVVVGGSNYLIANNTIANNVDVGGIRVEAGASNTIVRNNIVVNNGTPMWEDFGQNTSKSNNLGSTPATGWITGDPSFVNAAARDYHLQADSDAIDAGATVAQVASDFDGLARPQNSIYDIGAYEYPATPAVLAPTVTILTPTSAETFTTTQAELSEPADRVTGSAVDDISVASCSWVNTATGHSGATVGTTAWSIPILPLATGVNPVTVTCLDGAGNMGSDTLTITSTGTPVQSYRLRIRSAQ